MAREEQHENVMFELGEVVPFDPDASACAGGGTDGAEPAWQWHAERCGRDIDAHTGTGSRHWTEQLESCGAEREVDHLTFAPAVLWSTVDGVCGGPFGRLPGRSAPVPASMARRYQFGLRMSGPSLTFVVR